MIQMPHILSLQDMAVDWWLASGHPLLNSLSASTQNCWMDMYMFGKPMTKALAKLSFSQRVCSAYILHLLFYYDHNPAAHI